MNRYTKDVNVLAEQLEKLAHKQDVEQVLVAVDALNQAGTAGELIDKLETVELKLKLANAFRCYGDELQALHDQRPEAAVQPVDEVLGNKLVAVQQVRENEENIRSYLTSLRTGVDEACLTKEDSHDFETLRAAVQKETDRERAFKALATLSDVKPGQGNWIKEQAQETVLGVTDILWEIAVTGRDFTALAADDRSVHEARAALQTWQYGMNEELLSAKRLFAGALDWLEK